MFSCASSFNHPIGDWKVSCLTLHPLLTNPLVTVWDVSSVTDMAHIFSIASSFNQPIGDWDVSKVSGMWGMFQDASSFNQPIGDWDVSFVFDMGQMFNSASSFNQNLCLWGDLVDPSTVLLRGIFISSGCDDTTKSTTITSNWCQACQ
jgi:hypothetical protein